MSFIANMQSISKGFVFCCQGEGISDVIFWDVLAIQNINYGKAPEYNAQMQWHKFNV